MPAAYNLERFLSAQQNTYATALQEIRNGRKKSHWMWFIFPQIDGLGFSATAQFYAIKTAEEAAAFAGLIDVGQQSPGRALQLEDVVDRQSLERIPPVAFTHELEGIDDVVDRIIQAVNDNSEVPTGILLLAFGVWECDFGCEPHLRYISLNHQVSLRIRPVSCTCIIPPTPFPWEHAMAAIRGATLLASCVDQA